MLSGSTVPSRLIVKRTTASYARRALPPRKNQLSNDVLDVVRIREVESARVDVRDVGPLSARRAAARPLAAASLLSEARSSPAESASPALTAGTGFRRRFRHRSASRRRLGGCFGLSGFGSGGVSGGCRLHDADRALARRRREQLRRDRAAASAAASRREEERTQPRALRAEAPTRRTRRQDAARRSRSRYRITSGSVTSPTFGHTAASS